MHITPTVSRVTRFAKSHGWTGTVKELSGGRLKIIAERVHPEFGAELITLVYRGEEMTRRPEYTRKGITISEVDSDAIKARFRGQKPKERGTVKRVNKPPAEPEKTTQFEMKSKQHFTLDDDDDTIFDHLFGRKITVASTLGDYPPTVHTFDFDRIHPPKIRRFADGRVNVDYVDGTGFHSFRVNNILKVS